MFPRPLYENFHFEKLKVIWFPCKKEKVKKSSSCEKMVLMFIEVWKAEMMSKLCDLCDWLRDDRITFLELFSQLAREL